MGKFRKHIEPRIGNMQLAEITPIVLQKMFNDMLEENLSLEKQQKRMVASEDWEDMEVLSRETKMF